VAYLLAGLAFSFRAQETKRIQWWLLSILAAALLTGAKASNLPLLLPLVISWWPLRALAVGALFNQFQSYRLPQVFHFCRWLRSIRCMPGNGRRM
jgi:hypothetical protein